MAGAGSRGEPEASGDGERRAGTAREVAPAGLSPSFLAYVVGPIAFVLLLVLRHFGLVAKVPVWAYAGAIGGAQISGRLVERWPDAPPGSVRLHVRVVVHVAAVTSVVYLSGWGPALGMAFAFSAFADIQQSGAAAWRAALGWSLVGCAIGQVLVLEDWMPSFLSSSKAQTIGFLGAFVFGIAIRMAGAIGEYKERAEQGMTRNAVRRIIAPWSRTRLRGFSPSDSMARSSRSTRRRKQCSAGPRARSSGNRSR
jgi:hypothetical protein